MQALCWYGNQDVRISEVPDPKILNPRDAIVRITTTAICGSDLHLYGGFIPTMQRGDILGHEFMGIVEEVGRGVTNLKKGDRIVMPFNIACGKCFFCEQKMTSLCDNSNPNGVETATAISQTPSAMFGYSHMFGGYAGGQAQYVRVPFADVGHIKVPESLTDEQVLFLSDIFPTGYMAAENCQIQPGDTVAVWGAGPVGLFAMKSAWMLGAAQVIAIDRVPERLAMAAEHCGATIINYMDEPDLMTRLKELTGGMGPDSCIDAVGLEAHGMGLMDFYDSAKVAMMLETDRPQVLRQTIMACRKGGHVSVPGVYGGVIDKFPMGVAFAKGLTFKMGQTNVHPLLPKLLARIEAGEIDPSFVISHRVKLQDAPEMYRIFRAKKDRCIKVVLKP